VDAYREQLEQLRDSFNSRDSNGFAAVWHPTCEWHPFLTARVEGDLGYHGHGDQGVVRGHGRDVLGRPG
jgi:hypothetical protein